MGGDARASTTLARFFTRLNATRFAPYDWAGNEPSLWTPWEFDYFGAPWRTQATVRRIADTLYSDAPVDEPGNDDLGAISSWYVWAAIGLYPVTPGTASLALASPLFPVVRLLLPDGRTLGLLAPGASAATPDVHRVTARGLTHPAATSCGQITAPTTDTDTDTGSEAGPRGVSRWSWPWLPASVRSNTA